ncbi:TonB-dependent receptor [Burkholderiaceae bacterium DAT-1]|nr:TonB-dependent receptor [Burkholderiaceae bacterium DAT-1]
MQFAPLSLFVSAALSTIPFAAAADANTAGTIVITGARLPVALSQSVNDVTVLTRTELDAYTGQMLTDVLSTQPDIIVNNSGGPGKATSVYIRGATAQHTLVLIDGIRYSSATLGSASLQFLPVDQIERVEILRGPGASLYGADAIGGVIQIFTRQGKASTVTAGLGNDGQRQISLSHGGQSGDTRYTLSLASSRTDGVSAIANPKNSNYNPDKDGYRNDSLSATVEQRVDTDLVLGARALYAREYNQFDGSISDANWNPVAQSFNYRDEGTQGGAHAWARYQFNEVWKTSLKAGTSIDQGITFSPVSPTNLSDHKASINTHQYQTTWQNELSMLGGTVTLGAERLKQDVDGSTTYEVSSRRINSEFLGYLATFGSFNVQGNLRHDDNSQFGSFTSRALGVNWAVTNQVRIGTTYSTGFRAPTFNELYYPGYANPTLKPEMARNRSHFIRYAEGNTEVSLTRFSNDLTDMLQYNPAAGTTGNVGLVDISGTTLTVAQKCGALQLGGHLDWLDAHDSKTGRQLAWRARRSGALFASWHEGDWAARVELQGQGKRFNDDFMTGRTELSGYALTHARVDWTFDKQWKFGLRVNNVFDRGYTLVGDYGTLGRTWLVTATWQDR